MSDPTLEATLRRELAEEVPGLEPTDLMPFAVAHGDPELVERGQRTLARLRVEHRHNSPVGEPS
jgi:hypothetical protein